MYIIINGTLWMLRLFLQNIIRLQDMRYVKYMKNRL